jgi:hypothetical protein
MLYQNKNEINEKLIEFEFPIIETYRASTVIEPIINAEWQKLINNNSSIDLMYEFDKVYNIKKLQIYAFGIMGFNRVSKFAGTTLIYEMEYLWINFSDIDFNISYPNYGNDSVVNIRYGLNTASIFINPTCFSYLRPTIQDSLFSWTGFGGAASYVAASPITLKFPIGGSLSWIGQVKVLLELN